MSQNLRIHIESGEPLDVRAFNVEEEMSNNFEVSVLVHSENPEVGFDSAVGQAASFTMSSGGGAQRWHGVLAHIEQEHTDDRSLSTYRLVVLPKLWLLTHRRNHRMFQQLSEVEIVKKLLDEWGVTAKWKLTGDYKKRKYRVQYGESDFDFVSRMLEDAGISYYFEDAGSETAMVLDDAPHLAKPAGAPIPYNPKGGNAIHDAEHFSSVDLQQRVRPGKYTIFDHDYRKPATYRLSGAASGGLDVEQRLERFHYDPGAFLYRAENAGGSPVADDRGATRSDEKEAAKQAARRLAADRAQGKRVAFSSNVFRLRPGVVYAMTDHPRAELARPRLVVASHLSGNSHGDVHHHGHSVGTDDAFHPPIKTAKPRTQGVESATVVGPPGEEIHCDEFGRVRVQFHWDREGQFDENSSIWIHVNQPWGGAGYGGTNLPRIGQEVLVDFLGGDPDRPVIIGRVYTGLQTTPYKLPENKTQSGWKSNSTGGGGGFNEIKFEDAHGREVFSTQAQRDHQALVKHDSTHTTGNDYTHAIGHDESRSVANDRTTQVGGNESQKVVGNRSAQVQGDHQQSTLGQMVQSVGKDALNSVLGSLLSSTGGQRVLQTTGDFSTQAHTHSITSDKGTTITVGSSMIHIGPDAIIIQSAKILLNPGTEAATEAAAGGQVPAAS